MLPFACRLLFLRNNKTFVFPGTFVAVEARVSRKLLILLIEFHLSQRLRRIRSLTVASTFHAKRPCEQIPMYRCVLIVDSSLMNMMANEEGDPMTMTWW